MLGRRNTRHGTSRSLSDTDIPSPMPIRPTMILPRPQSRNPDQVVEPDIDIPVMLERPQSRKAEQATEAASENTVMLKRPQLQKPEQAADSTFMLNVLSAQSSTLNSLISAQTAATIEALKLEAFGYSTPEDQEYTSAVFSIDQATTKCKTVYRTHSLSPQGLGESPSGELSLSELSTNMVQHAHAEKTTSAAQAARLSLLKPMKAAHLKIGKNEKAPSHSIIPTYDDTTDTLCWWSVAMKGPRDAAEQAILQRCSDAALEDATRDSMSTAWWNVPPGLSVINRAVAKHKSSRPVSPLEHDPRRLSTIIEVDSPIGSELERGLSPHKLDLLAALKSPRSSVSSSTTAPHSSSSTSAAKRPDSGYADLSAGLTGNGEGQVVATAPIIQPPAKACVWGRYSPNRSSASSDSSESSMSNKSSSSRYFSAKHSRVASCNVDQDGEGDIADAGGVAL